MFQFLDTLESMCLFHKFQWLEKFDHVFQPFHFVDTCQYVFKRFNPLARYIYIYVFKWFNSSQASVYLLPEFQVLDKLQYVVQILDKLQYVVQILDKLQYVVQVLDKLQYVFQLFCARFNCLTRFKGERWH